MFSESRVVVCPYKFGDAFGYFRVGMNLEVFGVNKAGDINLEVVLVICCCITNSGQT